MGLSTISKEGQDEMTKNHEAIDLIKAALDGIENSSPEIVKDTIWTRGLLPMTVADALSLALADLEEAAIGKITVDLIFDPSSWSVFEQLINELAPSQGEIGSRAFKLALSLSSHIRASVPPRECIDCYGSGREAGVKEAPCPNCSGLGHFPLPIATGGRVDADKAIPVSDPEQAEDLAKINTALSAMPYADVELIEATAAPPMPETLGKNKATRQGWDDFFIGKTSCGFPRSRSDLHREWKRGYDAAKETSSPVVGDPVAWERLATTGWIPVSVDDLPHYRRMGQEIRALYARPDPKIDVAVKALERAVDYLKPLSPRSLTAELHGDLVEALAKIKGGA